jgi:hypothetical protein
MIGMGVGEEDSIDLLDAMRQSLLTKVRWRIHLETHTTRFEIDAGSPTTVPGIGGRAYGALAPNHRNPDGRAGAKKCEFHEAGTSII